MKKKLFLLTGGSGFIGRNINGGIRFGGDIRDYGELLRIADCLDGIVHLAAVSDKRMFDEDPRRGVSVNLYGLCNILEIALRFNLWVIFVSTFQVTERHLYGLSKLMGEELCRLYQKQGVRIRIIRLPIVFGKGSKPGKAVTNIIESLKKGKEPKIETDKKFYFAYVKDIAKMLEKEAKDMRKNLGQKLTLTEYKNGIQRYIKELSDD